MPRKSGKSKKRPNIKYNNVPASKVKSMTTRLIQISIRMDEYIFNHKDIGSEEAKCYLLEILSYVDNHKMDVRTKQVAEKLIDFMKNIIEEAPEDKSDGTTDEPSCIYLQHNALLPMDTEAGINSSKITKYPDNNDENMNYINFIDKQVDPKGIHTTNSMTFENVGSLRKQNSTSSIHLDHNYTNWFGPSNNHRSHNNKTPQKNTSVLLKRVVKNYEKMSLTNSPVINKYIIVKIPASGKPYTASPGKLIKIGLNPKASSLTISPNLNLIPKKILFQGSATNLCGKNVSIAPTPPTKPPVANVNTELKKDQDALKKPKSKRKAANNPTTDNTTTVKNVEEPIPKPIKDKDSKPNNKAENKIITTDATSITKIDAKKTNPNEEDLSWVENLKYVRVIEKEELCPPWEGCSDSFWNNLEYPPSWDDGVYLM